MIFANPTPIYPGTVLTAPKRVSVANTARDGSGTLQTLVTTVLAAAGGKGALVSRIGVVSSAAIGASTPMVCRLWRVDSTGAVITLEDEVALVTATTSNVVIGTRTQFNRTNIQLAAGELLKVTQSIAEAVDYAAEYGEY